MTRCVLYARVSTKEQDCTRQLVELRQVAENHGWIIVDEFSDTGSGATKSRPELDRMMRDAISRKFQMVATLELSRIGRNTKNLLDVVERLKEKNINLYIHNQRIDTSTASGSLFFTIASSFAQYERDLIRERVVSGLENAKRKGVVLGRKTNLTPQIERKIREMKFNNIGLKKIATECAVAVKTVRNVLAVVA